MVCALDMAGWDLYGKIRNQPLYKLWNLQEGTVPPTDYTIGMDSKEMMLHKINNHPSPIYKIKVGSKHDIDILTAIRSMSDAIIRVDANAGWSLDQAVEFFPLLKDLNVELIEQPLPIGSKQEMVELKSKTDIPIIADESCISIKDLDECIQSFDGINIKLTKCSGITPALELIKKARSFQLKIMLGCMNESSIGTAAMVHLSPLVDYFDADGPLLLKEDLANGLNLNNNHTWQMPSLPGLGIQVKENL